MLIDATLPLVAEHGTKVTTRQIAQAAGVAEGTIFRVFPDKEALVRAVIARALDPATTLAELRSVDIGLPLRVRVLQVTAILQRRLIQVFNLMMAVRMHARPHDAEAQRGAARSANELVLGEVVRLLEPDRDQFRWPVLEVARVLRLLVFSGSHPLIADGHLLTAEEIASVILTGVLRSPGSTQTGHGIDDGGHRPC